MDAYSLCVFCSCRPCRCPPGRREKNHREVIELPTRHGGLRSEYFGEYDPQDGLKSAEQDQWQDLHQPRTGKVRMSHD